MGTYAEKVVVWGVFLSKCGLSKDVFLEKKNHWMGEHKMQEFCGKDLNEVQM